MEGSYWHLSSCRLLKSFDLGVDGTQLFDSYLFYVIFCLDLEYVYEPFEALGTRPLTQSTSSHDLHRTSGNYEHPHSSRYHAPKDRRILPELHCVKLPTILLHRHIVYAALTTKQSKQLVGMLVKLGYEFRLSSPWPCQP